VTQDEPDISRPGPYPPARPSAAVLVLHDDRSVDPAAIAEVVRALPGVQALGTGSFGEPRTLFPGGDIRGLRVGAAVVELHLRVEWHHDLPSVAEDVRQAVLPLAPGRTVDVVIADLVFGEVLPFGQSVAGAVHPFQASAGLQPRAARTTMTDATPAPQPDRDEHVPADPRHGTTAQGGDPYQEPSAGRETEWFGQHVAEDAELADRLAAEGRTTDEIEQTLRESGHGRRSDRER
jgi:hypothetical protein